MGPGGRRAFAAGGWVSALLLVAIALSAAPLGVVVSVMKDAGSADQQLGQLVIASASVADFGTVVLLSLLFSMTAQSTGAKLVLLGGFALFPGGFDGAGDESVLRLDGVELASRAFGFVAGAFGGQLEGLQPDGVVRSASASALAVAASAAGARTVNTSSQTRCSSRRPPRL